MASDGTLQLNQPYVQTGLGTLTLTVPATVTSGGSTIAVAATPLVVYCAVTVPTATGTGFGAGTGADQGLGATGGSTTYAPSYSTTGAQQGLGNGQLGLGFGGTATDGALGGNGSGWGAGAGGGAEGFTGGDLGTGHGGVGQGFGAANGYQQPPADVITPSALSAAITSQLSVTVKQNGTTVYTAPAFAVVQGALQFVTPDILVTASDSITVIFASATYAPDRALNAIHAVVSAYLGGQ